MIRLLQPPRGRAWTGGYRYHAEMAARLGRDGAGVLEEVAAGDLGRRLGELGREHAEDLVVLDGLYVTCADLQAVQGRKGRPRVLLLLHSLGSDDPLCPAAEREVRATLERAWIRAVEGVIATGAEVTRHARALRGGEGVHLVRPGVGHEVCGVATAPPPGPVVLVAVGNVVPAKGQLELVRTLSGMVDGVPPFRLVMVGDDRADPGYGRRVREAARFPVEWAGILEPGQVAGRLAVAHLMVSASVHESFGMAVAEAAAAGVPVLAYRVGEHDRWVRDGENGLLLVPGDREGFAERLRMLLGDPGRLRRLRCGGGVRVPTWDRAYDEFRAVAAEMERVDRAPASVVPFARCELPTRFGTFTVKVYRGSDGVESLLLSMGDLAGDPPFVRVHSECFTGEVLHSLKCDCEDQLERAMRVVAQRGRGAVVYLRQEGRGIGLGNKIRAYAEQQKGADTAKANEILGFPVDMRDFAVAAAILRAHGVAAVELNTNNPRKVEALEQHGVEVVRVLPSRSRPNPHNEDYLRTKQRVFGHVGLDGGRGETG